jgi:hypothetical protein
VKALPARLTAPTVLTAAMTSLARLDMFTVSSFGGWYDRRPQRPPTRQVIGRAEPRSERIGRCCHRVGIASDRGASSASVSGEDASGDMSGYAVLLLHVDESADAGHHFRDPYVWNFSNVAQCPLSTMILLGTSLLGTSLLGTSLLAVSVDSVPFRYAPLCSAAFLRQDDPRQPHA